MVKLLHRLIQIARQPRDRLRADRFAAQCGHHAAHLTCGDAAQKSFPDQQRQLRRAALELLHRPRKKTLLTRPGNAQADDTETRHKVPFVVAVAVLRRLPRTPLVAV
jgi:hypothetical protein